MYHIIKDDIYYIYNDFNEKLISIRLDNSVSGDQVIIETDKEVYAGPISLLNLSKID